jgi:glycosyltransferase involved in cell wall biosynthesis
MRILLLSHLYPRPDDPGYGIFVHRQVRWLQRFGCDIVVLSPVPWAPRHLHFKAKWHNYGLIPATAIWENVPVYYPRFLRWPGAWFRAIAGFTVYRSILSLVIKLHNDQPFDLIHSHFLLPDGLAGVYLGRKLKLPTLCSVRGSDGVLHPYENFLNKYYAKMVITQSEQIVAVSQALKTVIESLTKPTKTIRVVYNGVDLEKFQESAQTDNSRSKMVLPKPYILFIGTQIYVKGLRDLLIAFARLMPTMDYNIVVIGPALPEVKKLDPELTELLKKRLTVTGSLPPDEIPAYIQNCELLVLPSYSEGLPNVVLEAMACGKPVIATAIMGIPEAVVHGQTGLLVQPGDPLNLAEAIKSLLNVPELRQEMGKRGRERVVQKFTWERNASEMVSIYREMISGL